MFRKTDSPLQVSDACCKKSIVERRIARESTSRRTGLARCPAPGRCCAARASGWSCVTTKAVSGPLLPRGRGCACRVLGQPRGSGFAACASPSPGGGPESLRCPRSCGRRTSRDAGDGRPRMGPRPSPLSKPLVPPDRVRKKISRLLRTPCYQCTKYQFFDMTVEHPDSRSSSVLCTGAALRRPSVWPVMRHNEGCFRTAAPPVMRGTLSRPGTTPPDGVRDSVPLITGGRSGEPSMSQVLW